MLASSEVAMAGEPGVSRELLAPRCSFLPTICASKSQHQCHAGVLMNAHICARSLNT